jgi:hypothetical protein
VILVLPLWRSLARSLRRSIRGSDEICHFHSDAFCLFESKSGELTSSNQADLLRQKNIFAKLAHDAASSFFRAAHSIAPVVSN